MKKKVAVFANAWGCEYLREVMTGAFEVAKNGYADLFCFFNFSSRSETERYNRGEINIFRLPDLEEFDGAIVIGNSFNLQEEVTYVYNKVIESGIPAISVEYDIKGMSSINTDNYYGMYELTEHLIRSHGAKKFVIIAGPKEHIESQVRLKAVQEAAQHNGITVGEEDILFGDWAQKLAETLVDEWIDKNKQLPDAFICANDVMAIGVCERLSEMGYSVPEDVIVTGYDCIERGREYDPAIASVSHKWHNMGVKVMELLRDKMSGKDRYVSEQMKTRFVPGGSCGCEMDSELLNVREEIRKKRSYRSFDAWQCDSHFRHIYLAIRKAEDIKSVYAAINELYEVEHWMEGDDFSLYLEKEFFNIEENDENLLDQGYSKKITAICSLKNGKPRPLQVISTKEAIFRTAHENEGAGMYIFFPLSSEGKNYGFGMITKNIDMILYNRAYIWTRHMNQYLEQVRRNITIAELMRRLTNLSVTDVLTGVYNRAGCEKIAYPILEKCKSEGETGVIMMADIDRMKLINDEYGHECGDLALCMVASALKSQVPQDWIVSRFGGDEFFIGGRLEDDINLENLVQAITSRLEEDVTRRKIAFNLKMSIGYVKIEPDSEVDLEKSLQKADELMYIVKKCHHEAADRAKNIQHSETHEGE